MHAWLGSCAVESLSKTYDLLCSRLCLGDEDGKKYHSAVPNARLYDSLGFKKPSTEFDCFQLYAT